MRFRRLSIPAYGPFTGLDLDFSGAAADLHVIYGRNEAGKSSLLRAIRDLLYGVPPQTADNFLHDYGSLRIGAELENRAGQTLAVQRRKGLRHTLLDTAGEPQADDALSPYLGRVDRDFFTAMFGLGSDELRRGAHELLQGKGDMGQALFAASLAGTPIHQVLEKLDAEARELFDGRAWKNVRIRPAVDAYAAALRESRQAQVRPEAWEESLAALDTARTAKDASEAELASLRRRQDWLHRCLAALPILGRLHESESALAELPPLPELPSDFAGRAVAARERLRAAEAAQGDLLRRQEALELRLTSLAPHPQVLQREGEINALAADLALYRQHRAALVKEQAEVAQLEQALIGGLLELGLAPDISQIPDLRQPLQTRLALQQAAATLQGASDAWQTHQQAQARLVGEMDKTTAQLRHLPQGDVSALRAACAAAAPVVDPAARAGELERLARRVASQQALLPAAPADAAAVYALVLPTAARLREFAHTAAGLDTQAKQLAAAGRDLARQRSEAEVHLARLQRGGLLPGAADLAAARSHRDAGWQTLLASGGPYTEWDGALLAETYPVAVARADHLADRLREDAEAIAQAEELRARLNEIASAEADRQGELSALTAARHAWQSEWQAAWRDSGLFPPPHSGEGEASPPPSPAEMQEWRDAWLEFRSHYEAWRDLAADLAHSQAAAAAALARLRPLLDGEAGDLAQLRPLAEARLRTAEQAVGERRSLEQRLAELRDEQAALARVEPELAAALAEARADWQALAGDQPPHIALPLMQRRGQLLADFDAWSRLATGIQSRQDSILGYEQRVETCGTGGLASATGMENRVAQLTQALLDARDLAARRRQIEQDRDELASQRPGVEQEVAAARADFADLLTQAGVADAAALQTLLDHLARRERLLAERLAQRNDLATQARGEPLAEFLARVQAEQAERLDSESQQLAEAIRELEARREQAIQAHARAEDAKARLEASGDAAAQHQQAAQHAAARIRHDAARFLRLRLAGQFLREQIEAFRARNQGPMLARAGELFRQMTGGSFTGLATDYDRGDTPVLVGLKDAVKVPVEGMSEGSRDQLYLSLRLAAIELHQAAHEPMPLILDDLFITFDDDRSRAILPLLADLARSSQVLLFTHHQHLMELAKGALPPGTFSLHELPAR